MNAQLEYFNYNKVGDFNHSGIVKQLINFKSMENHTQLLIKPPKSNDGRVRFQIMNLYHSYKSGIKVIT